jgi:hypothetical protein
MRLRVLRLGGGCGLPPYFGRISLTSIGLGGENPGPSATADLELSAADVSASGLRGGKSGVTRK